MTPSPQTETKIELVVECIEALTLAQVVATSPACTEHERHIAVKNVSDAREVLAKSLRELLSPALRVVQTERTDAVGDISTTLRRTTAEIVPYGGRGIDGMNLA